MTRLTSNRLKQRESAAKYAYRRRGAELVRRRWAANGETCEGCGRNASTVEVAHLFSKAGHVISDAMASDADLCSALCCVGTWRTEIGCHEQIDRGRAPALLLSLRLAAIARYALTHRLTFDATSDPLGIVRAWEHEAA